ncbi:MAG: PhoH family protein [Rhodospirillales bacterium]|nr:PhoH family protein [Rhodospirillales bacterium]
MTGMKTVTAHRDFADNVRLRALAGPHNIHLERLGRKLGVEFALKGGTMNLTGQRHAVETAKAALERLWERALHGAPLESADIDSAIRLAEAGDEADDLLQRTRKRTIGPRSPGQADYLRALVTHDLVFGLGPAGTGKTYLAVARAVGLLVKGQVDRIVLSRPAVEAGERLGFLPGDLREKIDPYLRPLYDALHDMLPSDQVAKRLESGEIEVAPLAFMRGRTLANAFVIVDEAQNTTPMQMKMLLTRLGENARMAVTGDPSQVDLPKGQRSGLADALTIVGGLEGVAVVRLTDRDVVRHELVTRIVRAYAAREAKSRKGADHG